MAEMLFPALRGFKDTCLQFGGLCLTQKEGDLTAKVDDKRKKINNLTGLPD